MRDISVMVVEDSPVARELITDALNSDPRLGVVCAVDSGEKALRMLPRLKPDIVSMDVRLPGMSGIEATRRIMSEHPTPVVVVAADLSTETVNNSMEALRAGALAVLEKPTLDTPEAYRAMARNLCNQFVNLSAVKLVRQRFNGPGVPRAVAPGRPLPANVSGGGPIGFVAIAASTGGPPAIATVLKGLGKDFPAPIMVVQHMGPGFLEGYASWLASVCDLDVRLVRGDEQPLAGTVYVAPGLHHLHLRNGLLALTRQTGEHGHVPSADVLFGSLASEAGPRAVGVLLTGMGRDGAAGLLAMRLAGAYTIAQDRETSAVYGMPGAASELHAAIEHLPVTSIAGRLRRLVDAAARQGATAPAVSRSVAP